MEKYVFSGQMQDIMMDMIQDIPGFPPLNLLISQVDRGGVKKYVEWKKQGRIGWLFIDSGAFSVHTGKAKCTVDEYIDLLNSIDEYYDVCAQLDTIPGTYKQPKKPEDYVESAEKSWNNYLYMRSKLKSPEKVMPVFHYGEDFSALQRMLEWKDENGNHLDYIGISPANDVAQKLKNHYMAQVNHIIETSSNPNVKTHLYGMTSLDALSKYKCYSADSITHRLLAGFNKILSPTYGIISTSKEVKINNGLDKASFDYFCDDYDLDIVKKELAECNMTWEQVQESSAPRAVFNMWAVLKLTQTKYAYNPSSAVKLPKRLF